MTELLTVEDTFLLGQGPAQILILLPDFPVPKAGWSARTEPVIISRPDGTTLEATAEINLEHFNIRDPNAPLDRRWRITIALRGRTKEDVPIGSKILISEVTRRAVLGLA